jgi:hypothetical protein
MKNVLCSHLREWHWEPPVSVKQDPPTCGVIVVLAAAQWMCCCVMAARLAIIWAVDLIYSRALGDAATLVLSSTPLPRSLWPSGATTCSLTSLSVTLQSVVGAGVSAGLLPQWYPTESREPQIPRQSLCGPVREWLIVSLHWTCGQRWIQPDAPGLEIHPALSSVCHSSQEPNGSGYGRWQ